MAINEEVLEETIISIVDNWLKDNNLVFEIDQDTDAGQALNDAWNDWYNDDVLLPVNQAVDEAVTNGGYDEHLADEDIYDICDCCLDKENLLIQLMHHCYTTGYGKGFKDGYESCDEQQ